MDLGLLSWRGVKTYRFCVAAASGDDAGVREICSLFDGPGMSCSLKELSEDETLKLLEEDMTRVKKTLFDLKAKGRSIPEGVMRDAKRAHGLYLSVRQENMKLVVLDVSVDAGRVCKKTCDGIVGRARDISI